MVHIRGKKVLKWTAIVAFLNLFIGFFFWIATENAWWMGASFYILIFLGIVAFGYGIGELARESGRNHFLGDLKVSATDDSFVAGISTEPSEELPSPNIEEVRKDQEFVRLVQRINAETKSNNPDFNEVTVETIFGDITLPPGHQLCYTKVARLTLHLDEDPEKVEKIFVGNTDVNVAGYVGFDIERARGIIWQTRGDFAKVMHPHPRVHDGIFSMFANKKPLVKFDGIIRRIIHPNILLIEVTHTFQDTCDKLVPKDPVPNPPPAETAEVEKTKIVAQQKNVEIRAALGLYANERNKPSHVAAELEDTKQERNGWEAKSVRTQDEKEAIMEERESGVMPEDEKADVTLTPVPVNRYGIGIVIGGLLMLVIGYFLSVFDIHLFGV